MRVWANFYVPNFRYHYKHMKISSFVFNDISNSYIRIYRYMSWYHSKPHIWIYFLVFVVISQIWHIEIRSNSHRLFVLLSVEFQENRILESTDICLGTKYCTLVQFGTESPTQSHMMFRRKWNKLVEIANIFRYLYKLQTYIGGHISVDDIVLMVETSCNKIESIELIYNKF